MIDPLLLVDILDALCLLMGCIVVVFAGVSGYFAVCFSRLAITFNHYRLHSARADYTNTLHFAVREGVRMNVYLILGFFLIYRYGFT